MTLNYIGQFQVYGRKCLALSNKMLRYKNNVIRICLQSFPFFGIIYLRFCEKRCIYVVYLKIGLARIQGGGGIEREGDRGSGPPKNHKNIAFFEAILVWISCKSRKLPSQIQC